VSRIDRRTAIALGGATLAAGLLPAAAAAVGQRAPAGGILLFEPRLAEARALARQARGQRLIALTGDPVRLWRDRLKDVSGPIGGITRWSDYMLLRDLAFEQGLRIRREEHIRVAGQPMLVDWTAT